ncbi:cytochrome c-type biogenesis protein [Nioella nitratireducens]|uniref:cytochrome c-type biogenesis protein n=1 Tax=Nioella nitratireducens TaxID=1287720 RepID=UPI0008FD28BE|nr:cytochrome c-type biogenesis protein [Nioella nitratireducens]
MKRFLLMLLLLASPVWAVEPREMLDDPVLESRARDISAGLRCLVCRNENIDDSHADLAHDLRVLVRERLVAGDTNTEVVDYIVERYGEYVLLQPNRDGANLILWYAGPAMALFGLILAIGFIRQQARKRASGEGRPDALSDEERARLQQIMGD